jgi:hypothetical protein
MDLAENEVNCFEDETPQDFQLDQKVGWTFASVLIVSFGYTAHICHGGTSHDDKHLHQVLLSLAEIRTD